MRISAYWLVVQLPIAAAMSGLECFMYYTVMEEKSMLNLMENKEETMKDVVRRFADEFELSEKDLLGKSRLPYIVAARHTAMKYIRNNLSKSYSEIGRFFGTDHATVRHAVLRSVDKPYKDKKSVAKLVLVEKPKPPIREPKPISALKIVTTTPHYAVAFGGMKVYSKEVKKGDFLITWSNGKQEIISSRAALKYVSLMDQRQL